MGVGSSRGGDNARLMELQDRALAGDGAAWSELWALAIEVCKRIAWSEIRKKGLWLVYGRDDVEDFASVAVVHLLARYSKHPGYRVRKNFVAELYLDVKAAMFHPRKCDLLMRDALAMLNERPEVLSGLTKEVPMRDDDVLGDVFWEAWHRCVRDWRKVRETVNAVGIPGTGVAGLRHAVGRLSESVSALAVALTGTEAGDGNERNGRG